MVTDSSSVQIPVPGALLEADLQLPVGPSGVVLFAHGSGSSRHSPRNRAVAAQLRAAGLATLVPDLLTLEEAREDERTARLRFDIGLLTGRLVGAVDWLRTHPELGALLIGLFGASTGAAAALLAAAQRPEQVAAVVSRGGRPDLAGSGLAAVRAATLLIVGGEDSAVLPLNRQAADRLRAAESCELRVVPGATHLFPEPGALAQVADWAAAWFVRHLAR